MSKFHEHELTTHLGYADENPRLVVFVNNVRQVEEDTSLARSLLHPHDAIELANALNSTMGRSYGSFVATPIFTQHAVEEIVKAKDVEFEAKMAILQTENAELRAEVTMLRPNSWAC